MRVSAFAAAAAAAIAVLLAGCGGVAASSGPLGLSSPAGATGVVAHARAASLSIFRDPGAPRPAWTLTSPTPYHEPLVLAVTAQRGGWDRVLLPVRPNGSQGWVHAASVRLTQDPYQVDVQLASRTLTVLHDGQPVLHFPVAVGKPSTPTPTGTFFITALLAPPNPAGAYGPYAYGLSGHSAVLTHFDGGDATIGLHGTNQPQLVGQAISHGCLRLSDADIRQLVPLLPLGTEVVVR